MRFSFAPGRTYTPADAPKEKLFALHEFLGIGRAVIVQASCHATDNAAMLDAVAAAGGRCRGIAMVESDIGEAEIARLDDGGIRGVRFNFVSHLGRDADVDAMRSVTERIAPFGWHAVVHLDADRLETLGPVLKSMPVTMVIDHMGRVDAERGLDQPAFAVLLGLMEDEHFWVKVSGCERISGAGPPFRDAVSFARALVERFPDRVLWGTDWPHPNIGAHMPDDGHLVDLLAEITPGPAHLHKLLVDNPTRLYWAGEA